MKELRGLVKRKGQNFANLTARKLPGPIAVQGETFQRTAGTLRPVKVQ